MFRPNGKCFALSVVIFSCLAAVNLALTDGVEQKKLGAPEAAAAGSGSVSAGEVRTVKRATPPGRLTVAVLWFEDGTGDPQSAHWRYAVTGMLTRQLWHVKAIRVLPSGAVDYAFRELRIKKGEALDATRARKMGELIEAQRVVWGSYRRSSDKWQVSAHVLNVAADKASAEFIAASADWFEVGDELAGQILNELGVTPSEEERQKMARRYTTSTVAYEWYSKAYALQAEGRPIPEQEKNERKAIAADPEFAKAYLALASTLGSQGKFAQAEKAVRQGLKIRPDSADAHLVLGVVLLFHKRYAQAEQEFRQAHRLDPDDPEPLIRLGQLYGAQDKWDDAIAFAEKAGILDPTNASIHAYLGLAYTHKRDRDKAMVELREAERLNPETEGVETVNAEQLICIAYKVLGEIPLALEHYERFVTLARKQGLNPKAVSAFEETARRLKASLTPIFIEASMPKVYTEQTLQAALKERLTKEELVKVTNPVAGSPEIKRWARQLTEGAGSDQDKARALFDGLTRRIEPKGGRGARTAKEVFTAWTNPEESFSCQEYTKLYVALARYVKLKAFYVHIDKDYRGEVVNHDCAVVFADGKGLLVDPAYRWFGVPHKEFTVLDDVQTIAHHFFQSTGTARDVSRCRLAAKLHPDFTWGRLALVSALVRAEKWQEARKALDVALSFEPDRWDAYLLRGILVAVNGNLEAAAGYLRKALELNPENAESHYYLATVLLGQGRLQEAREEYRACLRYDPEPDKAEDARRTIAQINESIGLEQTLSSKDANVYLFRGADYFRKGLYDQAVSDFTRAIEINPEHAEAYSNRGVAYVKKGDYDRAISDYNKALEIDPDYAQAYSNRGTAYTVKGDYDRAFSDFDRALKINPRNAEACSNRAVAYIRKGDYDRAILDCNSALEIDPEYVNAYSNRALAYTRKGEFDLAISDCNRALEINPSFADAYRSRGLAYKAKGEDDKAASDFKKYKEIAR
jgi:tetratricopeptide (TPR) repeat protein